LVLATSKLLMITGAGIVNLTAQQLGDDRYNRAPDVGQILTIFKGNQTIQFAPITGKTYGEPSFNAPANSSAGLPVRIEVSSGPAVLGTDGKIQILDAEFVTLVASQDGNENFNPAQPAFQSFNVARAQLNINVNSASRGFGQPNPTFTGSFSGLRNNDSISIGYSSFANAQSPPGNYDIFPTFQDASGKLQNYALNITRGTLTVTPNQPPVATAQTVSTDEDTPKPITLAGTDAEGATLTFFILAPPQNGILTGVAPKVIYEPNPNFNGADSFTFRVGDNLLLSAPATVNITVAPVNDPPTIGLIPNIGVRPSGPELRIPLYGITAGSPNEQQQRLTVTATSGSAELVEVKGVEYTSPESTGTVRVQPVAGATGSAVITVTVSDGSPSAGTATRTFTVNIVQRGIRIVNSIGFAGAQYQVPVDLVATGDENSLGFSLDFDKTKLAFVNAVLGPGAAGAELQVNALNAVNGRIGIGLARAAGQVYAAGTHRVALLNFSSPITVPETTAQLSLAPQPVFFQIVDPLATLLPGAFDGATVTITHGYEADVAPRPFGNNDGTIGVTDWSLVGAFAVGLETVGSPSEFQRADCAPRVSSGSNTELLLGDGVIGISDWVQAGRYFAGLDPAQRGGGPTATPGGGAGGGSAATQSASSASSGFTAKALTSQARVVRIENRPSASGRDLVALVSLEAEGNENAVGASFGFDPAQLNFKRARLGDSAASATLLINDRRKDDGQLGVALALPVSQTFSAGRNALVELEFTVREYSAETVPAILFDDYPVAREVVSSDAAPVAVEYEQEMPANPAGSVRVSRSANGEMTLRLIGQPGREYIIEASSDLRTWKTIRKAVVNSSVLKVVDEQADNASMQFYRVKQAP